MKKILTVIAVASVFGACNNGPKESTVVVKHKTDSIKTALMDSLKLDSFKRAEVAKKHDAEVKQAALASASLSTRRSSSARPTYVKGYSESQTYSQPATRKKGWSSAAKGAAIGGAAGAVTGVLVDKRDGRGAIIGGVVGAGAGYVIGRDKDRKSGRVQPRN